MVPPCVCLAFALCVLQPEAPDAAVPARVVITGKATSFIQSSSVKVEIKLGEDIQKKLAEAMRRVSATTFKVSPSAGLVVVLPGDEFKLKDAVGLIGGAVAVEGILTTTGDDVLLAVAGAKGAKQAPMLIATKATRLTEANQANFPAENTAICEGTVAARAANAAGESGSWAIRNGDGQIAFSLPKGAVAPVAGKRVRISGPIRVDGGHVRIEATKLETMPER